MAPDVEIEVTADLVRALLADQAPHFTQFAITPVASGWDNAVFRLGDAYAVRLPVRAAAAQLVVHEQLWLPVVAARLDLPVPVPVVNGVAGQGYPWSWSVVRWLEGETVATVPVAGRHDIAGDLGAVLAELHREAPADAPPNDFRGIPLAQREALDRGRLEMLATSEPDTAAVLRTSLEEGLSAPRWNGPDLWVHGDPHPLNLLTDGRRLTGLIDFGDIGAGDPASDLATAWLSFDSDGRRRFLEAYAGSGHLDDALWTRGRGWAAALSLAFLTVGGPDGALHDVARHAVRQLA
ncbi:aminoglycoside phosphotransferase family protein [Knoellia sp. CPCC 206453]|uniref:aminoglycoside phosphotransferase family protein n=1 Tax=Knoellia pratensis TaxID=3404796 RepID=UPI00361A7DB7